MSKQRTQWEDRMHKESLDGDRVFVIHDFLNDEETAALIARSEASGFSGRRSP